MNERSSERRWRYARGWLLAGLCALAAARGLVPESVAAPPTYTIEIKDMRFMPDTLTVRRGERIVWVNEDLVPHTVTHQAFDSRAIAPGASWLYVARKPGRYAYGCTFHPTMKAWLIVQ